jgi:hypothetical protein
VDSRLKTRRNSLCICEARQDRVCSDAIACNIIRQTSHEPNDSHLGGDVVAHPYTRIWEAIRALVKRAIKSGDIRKDLDPIDLLRALIAVANVATSPGLAAERQKTRRHPHHGFTPSQVGPRLSVSELRRPARILKWQGCRRREPPVGDRDDLSEEYHTFRTNRPARDRAAPVLGTPLLGSSRVGCERENANKLLTEDPETIDIIKHMLSVSD